MYKGIVVEYSKAVRQKCESDRDLRKLSVIWMDKDETFCQETYAGIVAGKNGVQKCKGYIIYNIAHYELGEIVGVEKGGLIHKLPKKIIADGTDQETYKLVLEYYHSVMYDIAASDDEMERKRLYLLFKQLIEVVWHFEQKKQVASYKIRVINAKKR